MKRIALGHIVFGLVVACSSDPSTPDGGSPDGGGGVDAMSPNDAAADVPSQNDVAQPQGTLASKYPGDVGMQNDPAIVWMENFEEGSATAVGARYDSQANPPGLALETDVPQKSSGKSSGRLTANGDTANATDLYKSFPAGYDEWYVRWYAKYETGAIDWHHTGTWFGGYAPATPYPNPQAGLKPNGDDRFSVSIEPIWDVATGAARFDTYDYWMQMHSWMDVPQGNTAYYGNAVVHQNAFKVDEGNWVCLEVHVKMNTDLASGTGAMLEIWKNDALVQSFGDTAPKGYWIKDKFCPQGDDGTECTDYPAPFDTVLDLQWRSTAALKLTYFWPQNYITTSGTTAWVEYDDMVIAKTRVGCLQ
jgi:hypothetical protein